MKNFVKKAYVCILSLAMVLSMAACGTSDTDVSEGAKDKDPASSSQQLEENTNNNKPGNVVAPESGLSDNGSNVTTPEPAPTDGEENAPAESVDPVQNARDQLVQSIENEANFNGTLNNKGEYNQVDKKTNSDKYTGGEAPKKEEQNLNKQIITQGKDGYWYDQNGNRVQSGYDDDYKPTAEESADNKLLIREHFKDVLDQGLHPYDHSFYIMASDTGRRVSREEYDSFVAAGYDPLDDDYLDSEHEAGLY